MSTSQEMRYTAEFTPEAWVRDYAVAVDAEGPTSWDCTSAVQAATAYFEQLGDLTDPTGVLDRDGVLATDAAAPQWVRDWHGPYTIRVYADAR